MKLVENLVFSFLVADVSLITLLKKNLYQGTPIPCTTCPQCEGHSSTTNSTNIAPAHTELRRSSATVTSGAQESVFTKQNIGWAPHGLSASVLGATKESTAPLLHVKKYALSYFIHLFCQ